MWETLEDEDGIRVVLKTKTGTVIRVHPIPFDTLAEAARARDRLNMSQNWAV